MNKISPNAPDYANWPEDRREEIKRNWMNRQVGSHLVSEEQGKRVWHLSVQPGERLPFHRHDCDYFWTVLSEGKSRSHYHDGQVREAIYKPGDTKHFVINQGEYFVHDLENVGDTELVFVTVEFPRD